MVNITNINGAGCNPEYEDIPWNLYEMEPETPQPDDLEDELIESSTNEIKLSTGQKSFMLQ